MQHALRAICCVLICSAPLVAAAQAQDNAAEAELARLITDYEQYQRRVDPITAGQEGDREALKRLPDVRPEAEQARRKELSALNERLKRIDARQLSPESALNHTLMGREIGEAVEEAGFDFGRIAFENDDGFHTLARLPGAHHDGRIA